MDFDPEIHVTDDAGNPVTNNDGSFRKKPGRRTEEVKEGRRRRKQNFGPQYRLSADQREGYHRCWVVEENLSQYHEQNDYEFVTDENGGKINVKSGYKRDGGEQRQYLMEIPEEYYREDQEARRELIKDPSKMREAQAGSDREYIPGNRQTALRDERLA